MTIRVKFLLASAVLTTGLLGVAFTSAEAQTARQQCTAKYQAAKAANTLNGQTYNQFYSACSKELKAGGATTTSAPAAAPPAAAPTATAPVAVPANPLKPAPAPTAAAPAPAPAPVATGNAVFPTAISPKYANEKAGIARRKTCDDQYNANKDTNGNGGLKWIMKGGGYYSQCNKRLKG